MVREFQSVIGREARAQILELAGTLPDAIVACVGGGSNAMGIFDAFIDDREVRLIGVEAGGEQISPRAPRRAVRRRQRRRAAGDAHLRAAGRGRQHRADAFDLRRLDYAAVGPEHAWLRALGRAEYAHVSDAEALEAFQTLARLEGILPALESAHAIAYAHARGDGARSVGDGAGEPVGTRRQGRADGGEEAWD